MWYIQKWLPESSISLVCSSFTNPPFIFHLSPLSLLGRDVIAQAQSGTGKTATFAVSILQQLDVTKKGCQALVLAPTRELAQQIQKVGIV